MSVVIKSNSKYMGGDLVPELQSYKDRVLADGGVIYSDNSVTDALLFAKSTGLLENGFSATSMEWGYKLKADGNVEKMYSLFGAAGDVKVVSGAMQKSTWNGLPTLYSDGTLTNIASTDLLIKSHQVMLMQAIRFKQERFSYSDIRFLSAIGRFATDFTTGNLPTDIGLTKTSLTPNLSTVSTNVYAGYPMGDNKPIGQVDVTPFGELTEELKLSGQLLNADGSSRIMNDNNKSIVYGTAIINNEIIGWLNDGNHIVRDDLPALPTYAEAVSQHPDFKPYRAIINNFSDTLSTRARLIGHVQESWVAIGATENQFMAVGNRLRLKYYEGLV